MLSNIFSNTSVKKKKLLWPLILSFNPSGGLSQWLTDSWIDYKSKCLIWKAMYYYTTVIQVMNFPFFSICKWWKMILFFFLFSHLENTPSYQGKHMWLLFHLCVSRNGGSGSQAISAFVHRPKCVWCVEKQTKTSANGIRLTLDKYNSHRKCVYASLLKKKKRGGVVNAHMNASKRWLCKPYKTWNTFRFHQLQTVSCFYVITLTTAILPFHNQPVSHSPHSHTSCPLIQGLLELAPTNAHSSIILAMKWRHHLCRGVISARTHAQKGGR